jgi:PAS domain S-box-containing protein
MQERKAATVNIVRTSLVLVLIGLCAWGKIASDQQKFLFANRADLIETYEMGLSLEKLKSRVEDAQIAERDFLIGGDTRDVQNCFAILDEIDRLSQQLSQNRMMRGEIRQAWQAMSLQVQRRLKDLRALAAKSRAAGKKHPLSTDEILSYDSEADDNLEAISRALDDLKAELAQERAQRRGLVQEHSEIANLQMQGLLILSVVALTLSLSWIFISLNRKIRLGEKVEHDAMQIRQSRDKLDVVLSSMGEGLVVLDSVGTIMMANESALSLLGYDRQDLLGRNFDDMLEGAAAGQSQSHPILQSAGDASIKHRETRIRRRDGSILPVSMTASVYSMADQKQETGYVVNFYDASRRARRENHQSTSFEVLRHLVKHEPLHQVMPPIIDTICHKLDWHFGELWLIDRADNSLEYFMGRGIESDVMQKFADSTRRMQFDKDTGLPGIILRSKKPTWFEDLQIDAEGNFPRKDAASEAGFKSACGVPVLLDDNVFGTIFFFSQEFRSRDDEELKLLSGIAFQLALFIEREQAQDQLIESRERYRMAIEASQDGIWEVSLVDNTAFWSKRFKAMLGYIDAETGKELESFDPNPEIFFSHVHPDDKADLRRQFEESVAGERQQYRTLYRIYTRSGELRWCQGRGKLIFDREGHPIKMIGTTRDITEERQAREKLTESERRFRAVFNTTFEFIGLLDLEGRVLDANKASLKFIDCKLEDVLGQYFWQTPWWNRSPKASALVQAAIQNARQGRFDRLEIEQYGAGEQKSTVDFSITPVFDEDGQVILMVPEARDISSIKDALSMVASSEAMFRRLAENIRSIFWIYMPATKEFVYLSPAFELLTGRKISVVLADSQEFFKAFAPDDQAGVEAVITSNIEAMGEFKIRAAGGNDCWLKIRSFPVLDENNNVIQLCGIADDISDRKAADKRVSEFYSTVSHELRTPLTSIRGSLGLLEAGIVGELDAEAKTFVTIARGESDRLIRLINSILDLRKVEAGKMEFKKENIQVEQVLQETVAAIDGMAHEQDVSLGISPCDDPDLSCFADRDRVVQILTNLISNAIKFSPPGCTVQVAASREGDMVKFFISDDGVGISTEDQEKLFGKFQQLDSSDARAQGGTGLGLAISKALVIQQGGDIGVQSQVGQGSTFWFTLPAFEQES